MEYKQLEQQYQDDVLAEALHSREREHFHYALDHANFGEMLKQLPPGDFRAVIEKRLIETASRMAEVETIHAALSTMVKDEAAHAAAVARTRAKREAPAKA